jgi:hypothetical protein
MFYEGDLQSGIALAVREAKHVICLVQGSFYILTNSNQRC